MDHIADIAANTQTGRQLHVLDHKVHRIDTLEGADARTPLYEMIVSNLRWFTLNIGVEDPDPNNTKPDLALKCGLLYENYEPVVFGQKRKKLLDGTTEATATQGVACFKLQINTLSSFHDRRLFRVRVSPVDELLLEKEPGLVVITEPMKSITKLLQQPATPIQRPDRCTGTKRRRTSDDVVEMLDAQAEQLTLIRATLERVVAMCKSVKQ